MARLLSVSVPEELLARVEELAAAQGKTKSEVVREALNRHVQLERFARLQEVGRAAAEQRGLGPEDAEAIVDAVRAERT